MGVKPEKYTNEQEMDQMDQMDEEEQFNLEFSDFDCVAYIRNALTSALTDEGGDYNQLISFLHFKECSAPDEVALLLTTLKTLSEAVSSIDGVHHGALLETIFSMSMWDYSPDVMEGLIGFITSLAVSSGDFVDQCLDMLVRNFTPPNRFLEALKLPYGIIKKEQVLGRVHSTLESIADLVPLAPSRLYPIIEQRMPNVSQRKVQVPAVLMFVENVFKLESSVIGELADRRKLILLVMDLLIDFDVNIDWDAILNENSAKGIFELELEDERISDDIDDVDDDGGEFTRESRVQKLLWNNQVTDNLEKLDSLMVLTFEHVKFWKDSGRLGEVFGSLLQSFQKSVLPAYKSKFSQFVIFYACSLDPEYCSGRFTRLLADIFECRNFSLDSRMSAVAYLASYLSRGRFLRTDFVLDCLKRLVKWCSDYCGSQNGDLDPVVHRLFYAGCQAVMYVLCFHMRSIMDIPQLSSQLSLFPWRQILMNPLQPLKVCLPSIVEEFVHQAKSANLLDERGVPVIHDALESEHSKAFGGTHRLDAFFPFDPCLLRKCDSFIRPNFFYWSMVRKTYEDEDEGSSDEDVDVIYPGMNGTGFHGAGGDDFDDFNDSLNKMSITPNDSFLRRQLGGESHIQMPSKLRPSMSPESL